MSPFGKDRGSRSNIRRGNKHENRVKKTNLYECKHISILTTDIRVDVIFEIFRFLRLKTSGHLKIIVRNMDSSDHGLCIDCESYINNYLTYQTIRSTLTS